VRVLVNPTPQNLIEIEGLEFSPNKGWRDFIDVAPQGEGSDLQTAYETATYVLSQTTTLAAKEVRPFSRISDISDAQFRKCAIDAEVLISNSVSNSIDRIATVLVARNKVDASLNSLTTDPTSPYYGKTRAYVRNLILQKIDALGGNFTQAIAQFNAEFEKSVLSSQQLKKNINFWKTQPNAEHGVQDAEALLALSDENLSAWLTNVSALVDISPSELSRLGFKENINKTFTPIRENGFIAFGFILIGLVISVCVLLLCILHYQRENLRIELLKQNHLAAFRKAEIALKLSELNCSVNASVECDALYKELQSLDDIIKSSTQSLKDLKQIPPIFPPFEIPNVIKFAGFAAVGLLVAWGIRKLKV